MHLVEQLCTKLHEGLSDAQRHEIVRLVVGRIAIKTTVFDDGTKQVKATIGYRFPRVVKTHRVTGAGLDYSNVRRVVQLPPGGRWPRRAVAA